MAMTAAIISGVAAAVGAGLSAYSSHQQGKAAKQQAEAQAALYDEQARVANANAGIAQVQAEEETAKRSRALAADIGSSYTNWAGNGLSVNGSGGTFGDVLKTQVAEGVADIDTIRDNGAIKVWSYQSQANAYTASAENSRIAGRNAKSAANMNTLIALNNGVAQAFGGSGSAYSGMMSSGATNWGTGTMFS